MEVHAICGEAVPLCSSCLSSPFLHPGHPLQQHSRKGIFVHFQQILTKENISVIKLLVTSDQHLEFEAILDFYLWHMCAQNGSTEHRAVLLDSMQKIHLPLILI